MYGNKNRNAYGKPNFKNRPFVDEEDDDDSDNIGNAMDRMYAKSDEGNEDDEDDEEEEDDMNNIGDAMDRMYIRSDENEEEEEDEDDGDDDSDEEDETPPAFRDAWDPFPDAEERFRQDFETESERLINSRGWQRKYEIAEQMLHPFLQNYAGKAAEWAKKELEKVIEEASGQVPRDNLNRYIHNDSTIQDGEHEEHEECSHSLNECSCYFEVTPEAGIPDFPASRRDRKLGIAFVHNLLVELLINLADAGREELNPTQQWAVWSTIEANGPSTREDDEDEDDDDDDYLEEEERQDILDYDTDMDRLWAGKPITGYGYGWDDDDSQEDNDEEDHRNPAPTQTSEKVLQLTQLLGMLGRRSLALAICRWGKGHLFAKRERNEFWNFSKLVQGASSGNLSTNIEAYLDKTARLTAEQPRYPTRVINTETLEFEDDQMLYRKKYAILSHTWTQVGREVTYDAAPKVLAEAQEAMIKKKLNQVIEKLQSKKGGNRLKLIDERNQLQEELTELERARAKREEEARKKQKEDGKAPSGPGTASSAAKPFGPLGRSQTVNVGKPKADIGITKLIGSIEKARDMGYTYIWVDSCCINKANNTELSEAISSMGDWYANADICLVYLEDVEDKHSSLSSIRKRKVRWAERGWTLQEIVMSRRAILYTKGWKEIADTSKIGRNINDKTTLAGICKVPPNLLCYGGKPNVAAAAVMKLSAPRKTTRGEDRAYCLMGMMGVRMAVDYGEGQSKAISRLLELIVRTTGDVSVFNWSGEHAGSQEPGMSMFPLDFDGFADINDTAKPLKTTSPVSLGHLGVHSRFDIWQMDIEVEEGNQESYNAILELEKALEASGRPWTKEINCAVNCRLEIDDYNTLAVKVFCPLSVLKKQLEIELNEDDYSSNWAMARFAGVKGAQWFLCAVQFDNEISRQGMFANFAGFLKGVRAEELEESGFAKSPENFIHYIESSGFPARRLATNKFDQHLIPENDIENVNLWVG